MCYIKEEQCIHTIHKWSLCKIIFYLLYQIFPLSGDIKKNVFDVYFFRKDIPIASDDIVVATSNHQGELYLHLALEVGVLLTTICINLTIAIVV